jgi:isoleucyl-tRNA synthetase
MDSGASWLAALKDGEVPCQLYLEGSDQHRGWFQSSLVLSAALTGKAPYESVLTHGFILDEAGRAMHKSLGNVVSPQQVVERFGADVLRLRFALCDYTEDVRMSDHLLEGPSEAYRKIRNTFKYLLGNVCDFDPARHCVAPGRMAELDRYLLSRLAQTERAALQAYGDFSFRKAATALLDFCALELSAFYLDARKDALYTLAQDDPVRRGAQSAMYECLRRLLQLAAPVLSFTCEEAWQELRRLLREESRSSKALAESVFLEPWAPCPDSFLDADLVQRWEGVLKVRSSVLGLLEERRAAKALGSSLQARAVLSAGGDASEAALGRLSPEAWAEVLIVSDVELRRLRPEEAERLLKSAPAPGSDLVVLMDAPAEPILAQVEKAPGAKCPRCWRYRTDAGLSQEDPGLCARCVRQSTAWSRR